MQVLAFVASETAIEYKFNRWIVLIRLDFSKKKYSKNPYQLQAIMEYYA